MVHYNTGLHITVLGICFQKLPNYTIQQTKVHQYKWLPLQVVSVYESCNVHHFTVSLRTAHFTG